MTEDWAIEDKRRLDAAEGWLELGLPADAAKELDGISPSLSQHPLILETRWKIYAAAKQWLPAVEAARELVAVAPDFVWGYLHLAYALHELRRTQEAYDVVRPVIAKFRKHWLIRYNLACYACQLGNLKEAMHWLSVAMTIAGDGQDVKAMALEDRDLESLWNDIKGI